MAPLIVMPTVIPCLNAPAGRLAGTGVPSSVFPENEQP
ncbi:uncharacterized, partial [Tachysurus ichikawai]